MLNRRFDLLPQGIGRFRKREQLAGSLGDRFKVGQQSATVWAALDMGITGNAHSRTNQVGKLGLEGSTGHMIRVFDHLRASF
jgi:hypothetical protein